MCGLNVIARAYNSNKSFSKSELALMCSAISHRGPDEANYALLNQNRLGLAKRLDLLMGIVMSVQMMHEIFIKNKPKHRLDFKFSGSV